MIGHAPVRYALERGLPPAAMLFGPEGIGKRTLVQHLIAHHQIQKYDLFTNTGPLGIDTVRTLSGVARTAPFGSMRVIALDLDEATTQAQNALLKILEEPPPTARFLLTVSKPPLRTVRSRCEFYKLAPLSLQQVADILLGLGLPATRAYKAAAVSGGQVSKALAADRTGSEQRASVVAAMKAISLGDRDGFHRAFTIWNEQANELLSTWFIEAISGQHEQFTAEETFGLGADRMRLLAMIAALSKVRSARARLGTRAALEPFLT